MLPFDQIDVFTDTLTLGNALAVVHGADGIDDERMAAFARWTNLSETTFLLAPRSPEADYRVRIFTASAELPFAGHPTIGSARAWLERGGVPKRPGELVQECAAGLVRVRVDGDRLAFAAPPLTRSGPVDEADVTVIAGALGIETDDVVDSRWADNGPGWVAVRLRDAQAVLDVVPDWGRMGDLKIGVVGLHPAGGEAAVEVRAFTSHVGAEDPVTGSLNAAIAQWLIAAGVLPRNYVAAQGTRLGRRGRVHVDAVDDDIWVGGRSVVGISGTVDLS